MKLKIEKGKKKNTHTKRLFRNIPSSSLSRDGVSLTEGAGVVVTALPMVVVVVIVSVLVVVAVVSVVVVVVIVLVVDVGSVEVLEV